MARAWAFLRVIFGWGEIRADEPYRQGGQMRNVLTAGVKTGVQVGVAALISWLASVGIEVAGETAQLLETGAFMVGTAIIAAFLNWLESKFPVLSKIFSLGLAQSPATYAPTG